jgi:hypothetical protein
MPGEPILGKAHAQPHRDYRLLTWTRFLRLRRWAQRVADHEGAQVYLVGSALTKRRPRDLDVSIIVPHDRFVAQFGPIPREDPNGEEHWEDPNSMACYMQRLHLYLYEKRYPWWAEDMNVRYTRLDLKICPDSWWPEKDKLLLAAPMTLADRLP